MNSIDRCNTLRTVHTIMSNQCEFLLFFFLWFSLASVSFDVLSCKFIVVKCDELYSELLMFVCRLQGIWHLFAPPIIKLPNREWDEGRHWGRNVSTPNGTEPSHQYLYFECCC